MNNYVIREDLLMILKDEIFKKIGCSETFNGVPAAVIYMQLGQLKKEESVLKNEEEI